EHDSRLLHEVREDRCAVGAAEIDADALLAPVVDGEVHALATDHRRMAARFLAADRLDLDHLGAEVGQDHAATRSRLEPRELEHADAVEGEAHGSRFRYCATKSKSTKWM